MQRIGRILAAIESALGRLAGFLLIALLILINVEVVARYVFNTSTLVADEYGGYLMAWMTMLGAVHLLRSDQHLTMTAFVDRLSPRARNLAGIVCGHIHRPGLRKIDGVLYCNDGDWVESCSALVEHMSGELSLWYAEKMYRPQQAEELVGIAA